MKTSTGSPGSFRDSGESDIKDFLISLKDRQTVTEWMPVVIFAGINVLIPLFTLDTWRFSDLSQVFLIAELHDGKLHKSSDQGEKSFTQCPQDIDFGSNITTLNFKEFIWFITSHYFTSFTEQDHIWYVEHFLQTFSRSSVWKFSSECSEISLKWCLPCYH